MFGVPGRRYGSVYVPVHCESRPVLSGDEGECGWVGGGFAGGYEGTYCMGDCDGEVEEEC